MAPDTDDEVLDGAALRRANNGEKLLLDGRGVADVRAGLATGDAPPLFSLENDVCGGIFFLSDVGDERDAILGARRGMIRRPRGDRPKVWAGSPGPITRLSSMYIFGVRNSAHAGPKRLRKSR